SLKKFYPLFDNMNFTRENVFNEMFDGKPYNDTLMRRHISDMIKMTEEYIKQVGFRKNSYECRKILLYELMARKFDPLFYHHLNLLNEYIESQKLHSNYYFQKGNYEAILVDFYLEKDHQEMITGNVIKRSDYQVIQ